jgi:Kdo2-lipid IVA lauroyltransferase/acyltransferase
MGNYYLYIFATWVTRALPLSWAYAIAVLIADGHYFFSKNDRHAVEANLKVILNVEDVPSWKVRRVFRNFAKYLTDFFTMTKHLNDDFIKTKIHINNIDVLNDVLKHGKGGIIMSGHLGNWEMAGAVAARLGYPLSVVALPHKDPRVNKFFNAQREYFGAMVIQSTTAVRRCVEQLRNNRLVAILGERDFNHHGMRMEFLGRPTMIPKGVAMFSLKTGAPIIPSFFIRKDNDHFESTFCDPIYPPAIDQGKITDEDLQNVIKQYIHIIEDEIRKDPTQWLMFREFWIK